ncbi:hypothetical protein PIB30_079464 [Stylosanthes scabra]|uniref:Uncharacterized protein n=1 Tax=Stylosanthes scabra TaxID=79078 RepID=A0ABU6XP53_9FABA|nr:hypothetical protein [Stylosanthes scabra]
MSDSGSASTSAKTQEIWILLCFTVSPCFLFTTAQASCTNGGLRYDGSWTRKLPTARPIITVKDHQYKYVEIEGLRARMLSTVKPSISRLKQLPQCGAKLVIA